MSGGDASAAPRRAARRVEANPAMRGLARSGYVANGVLHILIGIIALVIASGGRGEGDQSGALKALASAPFGFVALWVLAVGLGALGVWFVFDGILSSDVRGGVDGATRKWGRRVAAWGKSLVFLVLGVLAAAVALGARPNSEHAAESASRIALSTPGGAALLIVVGAAIAGGGVAFVVMGVRRRARTQMSMPSGPAGTAVAALGVIGFVCKGLALGLVGVLLAIAVFTSDAKNAGGLDGAATAALALPGGSWIVGVVGVGFMAYGAFCLLRARFARL